MTTTDTETAAAKARFQLLAESASAPQVVQLPLWPDEKRGAPNAVLRSSVFSASKPAARTLLDNVLLPVLPPYAIRYSGPQLYQPDLDLWLELVHRCRLTPSRHAAVVTIGSVLRGLGRPTNKQAYEYTRESAKVLARATVDVMCRDEKGRQRGFTGPLLMLAYDEPHGVWGIHLHPRVVAMFAPDEHTWLAASARRELGKSYLAKWLHAYYATHRDPLPISVERLRDLSGSGAGRLRKFREGLRAALVEVARVERAGGRRFEWNIDAESDLVEVIRG
jgi:hypothetical protein